MSWDDSLLPEQKKAAGHVGTHARLLAGPGTGKTLTLTRHICYLVSKQRIAPDKIMAFTFTRAAARELRKRVERELGSDNCPHISTLHSFALRQLIRNSNRVSTLPKPFRIADDWEERNIILEDIKQFMKVPRIDDIRNLLNELSADWQSLKADERKWEQEFPDARFLGIWREHRDMYGYTLRAELVYQLKRALEQCDDFVIEKPISYLIVDEYQDLNLCDLAVIKQIVLRGANLYIAGDDDQSIYSFRKAYPEGIRDFPKQYPKSQDYPLEICIRCDRNILELGLFVVQQDPRRIPKKIIPRENSSTGEVAILHFRDQKEEASSIATLCKYLITCHSLEPGDIMILLRSDHNGVFSNTLCDYIQKADIPVVSGANVSNSFNTKLGRIFLAFMRLVMNLHDSLAWRTLLKEFCKGVGPSAIQAIYELGRNSGMNFAQTIRKIQEKEGLLTCKHRSCILQSLNNILQNVSMLRERIPEKFESRNKLIETICSCAKIIINNDENTFNLVSSQLRISAESTDVTSLQDLLYAIEVINEDIEQEVEKEKINILTMHKAKGLTAKAVIIAAAEDEYIPGRATGDAIDDERRLFYVSLTRAKHYLFITYCNERTDKQQYTGREGGKKKRNLTRFLVDSPYTPVKGKDYIKQLISQLNKQR